MCEPAAAAAEPRPLQTSVFGRRRVRVLLPGVACAALVGLAVWAATQAGDPLVPENSPGASGWSWLYVAAAGLAFLAYLGGLRLLERAGRAQLPLVIALAAVIQLVPLAGPVLLTTDPYTYWDYGRLAAVHDANPYVETPSAFPADPAYERMGSRWRDTTSAYGPGFSLLSRGHAAVVGESGDAAGWAYKALAAASILALVVLAARLGRRSAFAAAFVGWNPLLAIHFGGGGHNDAFMMALLLGALALAAAGRRGLSGAAWAVAVAVKFVPVVLLPLRLLADRRRGLPIAAGFAAAAVVLSGLAFWLYGTAWLDAVVPVSENLRDQSYASAPRRAAQLTGLSEDASATLFGIAFAGFYAWLALEAWRGRARLGLAAGGLLVATTWLLPWYAVWAVPLAAVEEDRAARWLAVGLSAYLVPAYVPI